MIRHVIYSSFYDLWAFHGFVKTKEQATAEVIKRFILTSCPGGSFAIKVSDKWKPSNRYSVPLSSRLFVREHLPKILSKFPSLPSHPELGKRNLRSKLSTGATILGYLSAQLNMESETEERLKAMSKGLAMNSNTAESLARQHSNFFTNSFCPLSKWHTVALHPMWLSSVVAMRANSPKQQLTNAELIKATSSLLLSGPTGDNA